MTPKQCTDNTSDENDINHDNNNINDTNNDNIENNNDDENNNDENNDDKNNNDNKDNSNNNARIWKYRLQHIRHFVSARLSVLTESQTCLWSASVYRKSHKTFQMPLCNHH